MAVIKVFDSKGVKTISIEGNVMEQPYDAVDESESSDEETD